MDFNRLLKSTDSHQAVNFMNVIIQLLFNAAFPQNTPSQNEPLDLSLKSNNKSPSQSLEECASSPNEDLTKTSTDCCSNCSEKLPKKLWKPKSFNFDNFFQSQVKRYTANDVCFSRCMMLYKDHYHCYAEDGGCGAVMRGKEQLRMHGKRHSIAKELTSVGWRRCFENKCDNKVQEEKIHYHCSQKGCGHVSTGVDMERLQHVEATHYQVVLKRTHNNQHSGPGNGCTHHIDSIHAETFEKTPKLEQVNGQTSLERSDSLTYILTNENSSNDSNEFTHTSQSSNQYFTSGQCVRIFCNLKKIDHYHCPQCDVGCSKLELYIRHCRRHK